MKKVKHLLIAFMFNQRLDKDFDFFELTYQARSQFKEVFNSIKPTPPPFPADIDDNNIPPEIPRFTLETKNKDHVFTFSKIRFGFDFNNIEDFSVDTLKESLNKVIECINSIDSAKLKPFRIGIAIDGLVENEDNMSILSNILTEEALEQNLEHQISLRKSLLGHNQNYNNWTRYTYYRDSDELHFVFDVNFSAFIEKPNLDKEHKKTIASIIGDFIEC